MDGSGPWFGGEPRPMRLSARYVTILNKQGGDVLAEGPLVDGHGSMEVQRAGVARWARIKLDGGLVHELPVGDRSADNDPAKCLLLNNCHLHSAMTLAIHVVIDVTFE